MHFSHFETYLVFLDDRVAQSYINFYICRDLLYLFALFLYLLSF